MTTETASFTSITILLPAGRLELEMVQKVQEITEKHDLGLYLTVQQNLRLLNVPETLKNDIMHELRTIGARFKAPGVFPIPRVCVGKPHCNLGIIDTEDLSRKILDRFGDREHTKPKLKIGVSACSLSCSGARTSDIGMVAKKSGYEVYAGGKGGPNPVNGKRIGSSMSEEEVLEAVATLIEFHERHTKKVQRLNKLLSHPDFPFQ